MSAAQVAPHRCHYTEPATASGPSQMTAAGMHGKVGHTPSRDVHEHTPSQAEGIKFGSQQQRQSSTTNPAAITCLLSAIPDCSPATAGMLIFFPACYAVAMWMRRMNGSCRRAWTGLPTILPPATNQHPISLWCIRESRQVVALATSGSLGALRPSRAGPIERRAAPPAPTLALCGRSRAGLERGRRAVSCIIRWLLNLLAGGLGAFLAGVLFNVESRASSVDTPGALRRKRAPFASAPGHICFADGSLSCNGSNRCARAMHRKFQTLYGVNPWKSLIRGFWALAI
jgi:hypothetical protein